MSIETEIRYLDVLIKAVNHRFDCATKTLDTVYSLSFFQLIVRKFLKFEKWWCVFFPTTVRCYAHFGLHNFIQPLTKLVFVSCRV